MGWPFSGVSTGASGQAKWSGRGDPKCLTAHRLPQREREEESRATCIRPTWVPRWSAGILARSLLVCPIAFPQFRRMGWPFSRVSTGTRGQAKGVRTWRPKVPHRPSLPPEGGKKDRARYVFGQHGFHAGPRASLPAVSLCVPSGSLILDEWGGIGCGLSRGAGGQAKRSGRGDPKCLTAHRLPTLISSQVGAPNPSTEGAGRGITKTGAGNVPRR